MTTHHARRPLTLALALLALPACDTLDPEAAAELELRMLEEDMVGNAAICSPDRRIVKRTQDGCPAMGAWTGTSLFAGAPAGELRRMCSYEWTGGGAPNLGALSVNVASHSTDCAAVLEHTDDALEPELGDTLRELFYEGVNAPRAADLSTAVAQSPVTVVVVDASPSSVVGIETSSPHGEAMVDIIESLACPLTSCGVTIERTLALPRIAGGTLDTTHGGYFGSHGDLSTAIYAAANLPGSRKIINLSLGWEPRLFGDFGESTAVDAVHTALEYAACKGVLVVAAAGNEGSTPELGPVLPGGWETRSAPTQGRCSQLGVAVGPQVSRPLVYAVGGLRYGTQAMAGTREDGFPRLAAAAMHVTVGQDSPTLSGTSVSTAAVTGAAALVWSYQPTYSPKQVMDQLYAGGEDLGGAAEFFHGSYGAQTASRRLDVCDALSLSLGTATPHPLGCKNHDPRQVDASALVLVNNELLEGVVAPVSPGLVTTACAGFEMRAAPGRGCPAGDDPATPYVMPQPTQPACPNCTLKKSDAVVLASLDPEYDVTLGWTVANVDVELTDGTLKTLYRLGKPTLSSSTMTALSLGSMPAHAVKSATVTITFDQFSRGQVNQLVVLD